MSANGSRIALWLWLIFGAVSAAARTPAIQFAEPVALSLKSGAAEFDAYGRRFSLTLDDNERVLAKLSAHAQGSSSRLTACVRGSSTAARLLGAAHADAGRRRRRDLGRS